MKLICLETNRLKMKQEMTKLTSYVLLKCILLVVVAEFENAQAVTGLKSKADVEAQDYVAEQSPDYTTGYPYVFGMTPDEETILKKAPPNVEELAAAAGYDLETYETTTVDGYILVLHRMLKAKKWRAHAKKPVVLLQHGISQSAGDWLINDSGKSLAMTLMEKDYDVWLGNSRGNRYSNSHASLKKDTMEYYNFTFHEMGVHDFPATVDLILRETKQSKLNYIGCSLGVTLFFAALSAHPQYASSIRFMGALSPQVYLSHTKTPIKILAPHLPEIQEAAVRLNVMRINPETLPTMINSQLGKLCFWRKLSRSLCNSIYKMLDEFGLRRIEELMNNQDELFDEYDYGPHLNAKVYGNPNPPEYNLANVKVPVALFTGKEELFSTLEDVQALKRALPYIVQHIEVDSTFRVHTDFTHETKAVDQVFKPIILLLDQYNNMKQSSSGFLQN